MPIKLPSSRVLPIDAFRGLTIFTMIFVNELAGVSGIPGWMKHAGAEDDAMTFVDVVFPAFLFIVGMSIPFSFQRYATQGYSVGKYQQHTLFRTIGLVVMGVFMVNAEGDYNERLMGMSIYSWSLLFYAAIFLVWLDYPHSQRKLAAVLRVVGVVLLVVLGFVYRDEGGHEISSRWWGILGLIGWAYLFGSCFYLVSKGNRVVLILLTLAGLAYYTLGHFAFKGNVFYSHVLFSQGGHAIHIAIVLAGVLLSLIFFQEDLLVTRGQRYRKALLFALLMFVVGVWMRPMMGISKIFATPSWAAFSVVACIVTFSVLYLVIEQLKYVGWTRLLKPSAENPLLVYVLPFIVYACMQATGLSWPDFLYQGIAGIAWAFLYSAIIMIVAWLLTKVNVRLRL